MKIGFLEPSEIIEQAEKSAWHSLFNDNVECCRRKLIYMVVSDLIRDICADGLKKVKNKKKILDSINKGDKGGVILLEGNKYIKCTFKM